MKKVLGKALPQRRCFPGSNAEHFAPDSHRRTDLPPGELQGSHRKTGRQGDRPRPGGRWRDGGTEFDRGITPIFTAFWSLPTGFSTGLSGSPRMFRWRPPCRKTTSPSSILWASRSGGVKLSRDCPTQSPKVASSTFGTGPVSASRSMSRQLNPTYQTRIVTSSTETRLPQR